MTVQVYVSEDGRETPVTAMDDRHLVNAFAKSVEEESNVTKDVLKEELMRRLGSSTCDDEL